MTYPEEEGDYTINPDDWEREGGGTNKPETRRDVGLDDNRVLLRGVQALERIATSLERLTEMVRGRDNGGAESKSVLTGIFHALRGRGSALTSSGAGAPTAPPGLRVATVRELDGKNGNPTARFDPRRWKTSGGQSFKGKKYSDCSPEFLDELAESLDYFAGEALKKQAAGDQSDDVKNNIKWGPINAALARGWAARLRAGGYTPPPPADPNDDPLPC